MGKALSDILRRYLAMPTPALFDLAILPPKRGLTGAELLVLRQVVSALMGNAQVTQYIWDRLEGKAMQAIEVSPVSEEKLALLQKIADGLPERRLRVVS